MEPIRLGLVGLRYGGTVCEHLTANPSLPVRVVGVTDLDPAKVQRLVEQCGVRAVPTMDDLLADPEVEAVGLYTPPAGRAALVRRALEAGKHVMATKPFELDPEAALAVLHEARDRGLVLHLNSPNPRPYGEMAYIARWVGEGAIGRPVLAQANTWVSYHEQPDGSWYDDPARCPVAPIFRIGIYALNNLLTVFGEPAAVSVAAGRVQTGRPTPDNASLTITCHDGAVLNIMASFAVGGGDNYKDAMTIAGTEGVIYYGAGPRPEQGLPVVLAAAGRREEHLITSASGTYDWQFFAERVRGIATADITTPEQIVAAIRVLRAMARAEKTGQVEPV